MPPKVYEVEVTLTARLPAADSASAAATVLRELRLQHADCQVSVTVVREVGPAVRDG